MPAYRYNTGGVRVSLENFKKQAKLLVRWHRERNYSVGGRIRQLARYQDVTDEEALALRFPLSEAQEIVAAEQGYASWAALKDGVRDVQGKPAGGARAARLTRGIPMILVSDVDRAAGFYRDLLGFTIDFLHGNPPFYGAVSRDEVTFHLRMADRPAFETTVREQEQLLTAFVSVSNVKELFREYEGKQAKFVHRLRREPWGQSAFIIQDPDGNWICFAG